MSQTIDASILTHFASLEEIRDIRGKEHLLLDIITIALCAVISGAEGWEDMAEYGRAKQDWLATFLSLPSGIPCADTFGRVFARLDPDQMPSCFASWVKSISKLLGALRRRNRWQNLTSFWRSRRRQGSNTYGERLGECESPSARTTPGR